MAVVMGMPTVGGRHCGDNSVAVPLDEILKALMGISAESHIVVLNLNDWLVVHEPAHWQIIAIGRNDPKRGDPKAMEKSSLLARSSPNGCRRSCLRSQTMHLGQCTYFDEVVSFTGL